MKFIYIFFLIVLNIQYVFTNEIILLYPKSKHEISKVVKPESTTRNGEVLINISTPRIEVFVPDNGKTNGSAVLIVPGGAYSGISMIREGKEVAEWFNNYGFISFVLYYRMPNGHPTLPLEDAQASIKLIRRNSKKWNVDKNKIGVIGFSAGGHLAASLSTHSKKSCTPDFMMLIYPVITMEDQFTHLESRINLMGKNPSEKTKCYFSNELQVSKNTPPTFIIHAKDDPIVKWENSRLFYEKLKKNQIKAKLVLYNNGKHGFGLRLRNTDSDKWTIDMMEWLKEICIFNNNLKY